MQNREVCALTWSDIELNVHGFSYFKVSKFVDQNGKIVSHILREDLKRFRSIPICRFLQHALDLRYHYLLSHGISKETLSKSPIILSNESIASMQSGQIPHFCNPITSSEICKKISKQVRVEEKWIILPDADKETHLDVYKYHGDIYTSTFKNRLETICSMPENDIRYLVGNEPLNTLSRHYEAFDHPDVQNMLFIGIERWASQYLPYFGKTKFGEISDSKELTDSTTIAYSGKSA